MKAPAPTKFGDREVTDSNRYTRFIGKTVFFNWGRSVQMGKLLAWSPEYQRATIEMKFQGHKIRLELKVGRTTGFGVVDE